MQVGLYFGRKMVVVVVVIVGGFKQCCDLSTRLSSVPCSSSNGAFGLWLL